MKFFYSILICGVLIQSASCQNTANTQAQTATQQNVINQKISVDEYEKKLADRERKSQETGKQREGKLLKLQNQG